MRLVIHDPPGHPFPVQLSRELARRGHHVLHIYSPFFGRGRGDLVRRASDQERFEVEPVSMSAVYAKERYVRRAFQEIAYGAMLGRRVVAYAPDVVISANTPLDAQRELLRHCRRANIGFVFWLQDLYSVAISQTLSKLIPLIGTVIGKRYRRLERNLLQLSSEIVAISTDFLPQLRAWGIIDERVHVIENWAPLDELVISGSGTWAAEHGLADKPYVLYAGTLGLKHDPGLLVELARALHQRDVRVVVASEGRGANWVAEQATVLGLSNLIVVPFQPYGRIADMMAGATILVAILEPQASAFSVPSKVLAYLCAGRPVLAAIAKENLAARILTRSAAGWVVPSDDPGALAEGAEKLLDDAPLRARMGGAARAYAARTFDIQRIADDFEGVVRRASRPAGRPGRDR